MILRLMGAQRGILGSSAVACLLGVAAASQAYLYTSDLGYLSPEDLAGYLAGPGVTISNVTYQGRSWAAAEFFGGDGIIGFDNGIVLTTGFCWSIEGSNDSPNISNDNAMPGDADLTALAGVPTADAAVLDFDFVPSDPNLSFSFVFGSEEYNEYVGSWNDVFAFYLDGVNIALVPGTTTPVSVNSVNLVSNTAYFVNNDQAIGAPLYTQLDGLTTVITLSRTVEPGVPHHIKFAIADGGDAQVDSAVFIKASSFTSLVPALTIKKEAPQHVPAGDPIPFTLTVKNIGTGTAVNVVAWDSVPPGTTLVTTPPGAVLDGGMLVWALGDLSPGVSVVMIFDVTVDAGTAAVVNTAGTCGRSGGGGGSGGSGGSGFAPDFAVFSEPAVTEMERPEPCVWMFSTPWGGVCSATVLTYEIDAYNCGDVTMTNLVLTDSLPANVTYVAGSFNWTPDWEDADAPRLTASAYAPSYAGPWTAGEPPGGAVDPTVMRWVVDRVPPGRAVTLEYAVVVGPALPSSGYIWNAGSATIAGDSEVYEMFAFNSVTADLVGALTISTTMLEAGEPMLLTATATNTGCSTATGVAPVTLGIMGGTAAVSGPLPGSVASLAQGDAVTFTWTVTPMTPGTYYLTTRVSGIDEVTGGPVSTPALQINRIIVIKGPVLSGRIACLPASVCPGDSQLVVLTVSNSGGVTASAAGPGPLAVGGAGGALVVAGPWPAPPATLAPGATATFTWTATALTAGALDWSTTVSGLDTFTGRALAPEAVDAVSSVWTGAVLAASLSAPPTALLGRLITIALTVTEVGGVPVSGLTPAGPAPGVPGTIVAGPSPAGPQSLLPGSSVTFVWTFSVSGAGTLGWSATASGFGCASIVASATATGSTTVPRPANLRGSLSVSATVVIEGQSVVAILTVTNTGETAALGVVPVLGLAGAPAVVTAGPSPGSSAIPPGGSVSFAWTVSTAGLGLLDLTAWGAGTDADTGWLVQSPAAGATVLVQGRARLAIESFIAGPRPCGAGQPVTATLVVRNIGGVNAVVDGVFPGVLPSPAGTAGPSGAVAPAAPFTVAPGASVTFTWTVPTTVCGAVRLSVTVTGTEALSGRPLGPLTGETLPVGIYAAPASVRFIRDHDSAPCKSDVTVGVIVEDGCGNAVPGQAVDFSVESGGATPPACSVVTDAAGKASYTMRLGLDAGPNRVKARVRTTGQSATGVVTSELPPGALVEPGAALDRNVFTPTRGESVLVRVLPVNDEPVVVRVYTASGRLVRTLRSLQPVGGGRWSVSWNGLTEDEFVTTPGVYLVKLSGGGLHDTLKVVVH